MPRETPDIADVSESFDALLCPKRHDHLCWVWV